MRLTLGEIRQRAIAFAHDWKDETSERAEAQTFWNEFFHVFGKNRRTVAAFERTVASVKGSYDRIDLIWNGVMIAEHKSRGQDLSRAATQAFGYVQSLARTGQDQDVPRYVVVSDFARIAIHDLESTLPLFHTVTVDVANLHEHLREFDFISGYEARPVDPEDPANEQAVQRLGTLHDALQAGGYAGHRLERFLVRILFCLFAEDTGIFDPDTFKLLVEDSREDGSTLGGELARFFDVLNTPEGQRSKSLPDPLRPLPYVNGQLFAEPLGFADFNADMRSALLAACRFQWSRISPAVFGSLFQSILADDAGKRRRRQIGAHYTSERDIMKVVRSLFLDDLQAEFDRVRDNRPKLVAFHEKLSQLKFLDPACGCGNFLVVTYRELRRLEHQVIDALFGDRGLLDLSANVLLNVDQMHGIEIEEWPARIAEVAMWLVDHQMNQEASQRFGKPLLRLPLGRSARIEIANALRTNWDNVLPRADCSYILGNPPFVGHHWQSPEQKADQSAVLGEIQAHGVLDFVSNWYVKAAAYIADGVTRAAFVSTNSITQGEQVGILWTYLFERMKIKIAFAHRTFSWESEARGAAHVHVVVIGFARTVSGSKKIFEYANSGGDPVTVQVGNISPYLVEGPDRAIRVRSTPICAVPKMLWGNKPTDGGHLLMDSVEKDDLLAKEPGAEPFIRPFMSGGDFIDGVARYCLWLVGVPPNILRSLPLVMERVEAVKAFRLQSKAASTRAYAVHPTLFRQIAQPSSAYLAIPEVSSERRDYIPIAYLDSTVICSNKIQFIPNATIFEFGVLTSSMHMAWTKAVCGRMKSDISYSNSLVYNNFPWPTEATEKQRQAVERAAQGVLSARAAFPGQTLADLYDPLAMPKPLRDAHRLLDAAVDKCYRPARFESDRQRVEYLFQLYEKLTSLFAPAKKPRQRKSS